MFSYTIIYWGILFSKAIKEGEPDCLFPCTHHKRRNFFHIWYFFTFTSYSAVWWVLSKK